MSLTMKILSSMYNILILLGLSWQVYEVSHLYFKFDVLTHLDINFDDFIVTPDMSICITYYDVLDIKLFNEMTGNHLDPNAIRDQRHRQNDEVQSKITLSQLFKLTPEERVTIKSCFLRDPKTYTFEQYSTNKECLKHFQVEKYSFMDSICYRYSHKIFDHPEGNQNLIYSKRDVVFSPDDPGLIFIIRLADSLNSSNRLRIMMHPANQFPWIEAAYTSEVFRSLDDQTKTATNNLFSATSSRITVKKLPPPFTSNCRNYSEEGLMDVFRCRQRCFRNKTLSRFDKVPFNSRIIDPLDKKRICTEDINDHSVRMELIQFQKDCNEECKQDDCFSIITSTNVEPAHFEQFTLMYKTPIQPSLELKFSERLSFTEFIVYVTSCFGIWLGVSAYHSNPFRGNWVKILLRTDWIREYFNLVSDNQVRQESSAEETKGAGVHLFTIRNERQIENLKRMIADQVFKMVISNLAQARERRRREHERSSTN